MGNTVKYIAASVAWSSISKILNTALKFISIPLLLHHFGKDSFGLLTLAVATNAYMQLLDMGMNYGAVRFFSQWIVAKNYDLLYRVARTNLSFYLCLGVINCLVLLLFAWQGDSLFKITPEQFITVRYLLCILAGVSIINWAAFVFNQLLIAEEKIAFVQQMLSIRSIANFLIVLFTIHFEWSVIQYFLCDSISNMLIIVPCYWMSKKRKLIQSILPALYWKDFSIIFKYSLAVFAMGIFQFTALQSRPLVLGMFSPQGQGAATLADYRVLEVFSVFVISIGGMLLQIILPKASQFVQQNDCKSIENLAYEGTKYNTIGVAILCYLVILNAKEILILYVGDTYDHLSIWLSVWMFALLFQIHYNAVSSLVFATGKMRTLVYASFASCVVSIVTTAVLCVQFGAGSAVIGYVIYVIILMLFHYLYYNARILKLNSRRVFRSFIIPAMLGLIALLFVELINLSISSLVLYITVRSLLWLFFFFISLVLFKQVNIKRLQELMLRRNVEF